MTFEHDAVIVTLASRASDQIRAGLASIRAGEPLQGEVFLNASQATLANLIAHLDGTPAKPLRKIAIVHLSPDEDPLPAWMHSKKGGPDGSAA